MAWCRILGSSGDSHARISAVSSLPRFRLITLLPELILLYELVLIEPKLILVLKELSILGELLPPPRRGCNISVFWCLEQCGFNVEDSKDGFLSTVGSIDRLLGFNTEGLKDEFLSTVGLIDRVLEAEEKWVALILSILGEHPA